MPFLPAIRYLGSFQRGDYLQTDNPLEEVWSRVARFGIADYLKRMLTSHTPPISSNWDDWGPYAVIRVRQAVEFRRASAGSTLLTRPLPLYYSFLNLIRGFLAIEKQIISSPRHGLKFTRGSDTMSSSATLDKGTFLDYLNALGIPIANGESFTLEECAASIVEVSGEYVSLQRGWTNAVSMLVEAKDDGEVLLKLHYPRSEAELRVNWQAWFPALVSSCTLEPTGTVLRVAPHIDTGSREAITDYLWNHLWVDLKWSDRPVWYVMRQVAPKFVLSRPAYYHIAMYILGSAVRYEPELLLDMINPDSDLGWFLGRLTNAAERYFPQLMLHWIVTKPVFF